jgi:phosphatidylserine/phosphatidylglycerophosphate/cardiolipin synthase-like enzyme
MGSKARNRRIHPILRLFVGFMAVALVASAASTMVHTVVKAVHLGHGTPAAAASPPTVPPATPATPAPTTTPTTLAPTVSLITEPNQGMGWVTMFIGSARKTLDMTMYELSDPAAEQALIADHQRGVAVRVLLDAAFHGKGANQAAYALLTAHGVAVRWAPASVIYHQKTITADGTTSAVGTGNLTASYYPTSRDFWVMDPTPADVSAIESTFGADWSGQTTSAGPSGADLVWSPGSQTALVGLIDSAHRTLQVENEEMASTAVEQALEGAARRGVQVHVTMTWSSSWGKAFAALSSSGVQIRVYHGETPLYIHAKAIVADAGTSAQKVFLGSENFSTGSMERNRELGMVTTNPALLTSVSSTLTSDFSGAAPW